ncbi:mitochondrial ribosomal protein L23 [Infundibulicybe gibba]|nr:mitochondrial ribosomal protein L23 [Infundibulicybe gibba]
MTNYFKTVGGFLLVSVHIPHSVMQALGITFRRLYTTKPPMPEAALAARTASTPLAVRLRRRNKFGPLAPGASDATPNGLTPTEHARYQRLHATGQLAIVDGKEVTEAEWLARMTENRSRVRGFKSVRRNGVDETEVLGRRVYLPNIIFRLVRNNTPPGQPYNPYEATFRIPKSITKTDVRSYLLAVYGVKTTYIRTDNYISPVFPRQGNKRKSFKTYKRAVVGLVDPFYYPLRLEDMAAKDRQEREKWIEERFQIQATRTAQKYEMLRLTKGQSKGWKFKEPLATKRSHILRLVAERRAKREGLIMEQVNEWRDLRERGERIAIDKPAKTILPADESTAAVVPAPSNA